MCVQRVKERPLGKGLKVLIGDTNTDELTLDKVLVQGSDVEQHEMLTLIRFNLSYCKTTKT